MRYRLFYPQEMMRAVSNRHPFAFHDTIQHWTRISDQFDATRRANFLTNQDLRSTITK